jgi:hypothetical protein
MKNRTIISALSLVLAVLLFSTCEKTPIEKAQDAYDASMVVPAVLSASGPTLALQTKTYNFSVTYYRAGSTWAWSAVDATVQSVSTDTRTATILFDKKPANDTALVKITETTVGGTTSAEKIMKVKVDPFCPVTINDLVGTWNVVETGSYPRTSVAVVVAGTGADEIIVKSAAGIPGLLGGIFLDWGEAFQATVAPGGDITLHVNLDNGSVTVPFAYWGQTLPGPYDYWYFGAGTWDGCGATPKISLSSFKLDYDGVAPGVARANNAVVMTKQ